MFLVNSRGSPFTAASSGFGRKALDPTEAPLLPKVRGYFAEFLSKLTLTRLGIFSLSTCVGLQYGHLQHLRRSFSRQRGVSRLVCPKTHFPASLGVLSLPGLPGRLPLRSRPGTSSSPWTYPSASLRRSKRTAGGGGMLTPFPSPTPFGLGLGAG